MMRDLFSSKLFTLALILIIAIVSVIISAFLDGLLISLVVSTLIIFILLITKKVWLPSDSGRVRIRSLSLWVIAGVASTNSMWNGFVSSIFSDKLISWLKNRGIVIDNEFVDTSTSIIVLLFVLIGIFIVNHYNSDKTAMGIISKKQQDEIPDRSFSQQLLGLKRILENSLRDIDVETNWSDEYFVPLEAEVEIKAKARKDKKVTNLISALKRNNKEKVLLVLGDPGAGKSVALRKLSKDLLKEVEKTGKIPLYVNLREWEVMREVPTIVDLHDFVFQNTVSKCDVFASEFLHRYYDKMVQSGRFFFILDSFDEIPSILDEDESSDLIDSYSAVICNFLDGSIDSRGILASRVFRKPTQKFKANTIFEIRPFSEDKILQRFEKSVNYNSDIRKLLFSERPEFISLARNPFTASLIFNYAKNNLNTLPVNRMDLYKDHIERQLKIARRHPSFSQFGKFDEIISITCDVAFYMFNSKEFGLEIPIDKLKERFTDVDIDKFINILSFIRLGRFGSAEKGVFSFVHRRFNEFFVALKYSKDDISINLESIPSDSRWRDALVLYCEISDESKAKEIAEYCWNVIKKAKEDNVDVNDSAYLRSIHALRFLSDAFKARKNLLDDFIEDLADHIKENINASNLLVSKLFVESTGVLRESDSESIIKKAFKLRNTWVSETAIRSCRNLPEISMELDNQIRKYLLNLDFFEYQRRSEEFIFSFGLSDGFNNVKRFCQWLRVERILLLIGLILTLIIFPTLIGVVLVFYFIMSNVGVFSEYVPELDFWRKKDQEVDESKINVEVPDNRRFGLVFRLVLVSLVAGANVNDTFTFFSKNEHQIFEVLSIISVLLVFPYTDLFFLLKNIRRIKIKELLRNMGLYAIGMTAILIASVVIPEPVFNWLIFCVGIAMGVAVLAILISSLYSTIMDKKKLSKLILPDRMERKELLNLLFKYNTAYARGKVIQRVENQPVSLYGSWPKQPSGISAKSAIILAKIDEKSLGFDR